MLFLKQTRSCNDQSDCFISSADEALFLEQLGYENLLFLIRTDQYKQETQFDG